MDSTKLPLAGIRVLDMTRVLAGVGQSSSRMPMDAESDSHIALRYSATSVRKSSRSSIHSEGTIQGTEI